MIIGRLISGVHWATDIIGSVLLSAGLYMLYRSAVLYTDKVKKADSKSPGTVLVD
jgi:undecaprenyl-diphosphatase